ncbi:hypothetical protein ACQ4PT_023296 [Festuca glaucescens]
MEHIVWSDKKRRSTGSRRSSVPRLSSSSSAREYATREKEVLVYHRRSAEEREAAAERNRLHRLAVQMDAAAGLEELGHGMIGNAVINDETDQLGMVEYAWSHAIISDELHASVTRECDSFKEEADGGRPGKGCSPAVRAFMSSFDDIDIYSIYTPTCLATGSTAVPRPSTLVAAPRLFSQHEAWHMMRRSPAGLDPCTEAYVTKYFNRRDVQRALHANRTALPYPYSPCSAVIHKWNDSPATVLPILKKLMGAGLRIWVYSGDTDGRVPVTSTRYSINAMKLRQRERTKGMGLVLPAAGGRVGGGVRGGAHAGHRARRRPPARSPCSTTSSAASPCPTPPARASYTPTLSDMKGAL